MWDAVTDGGLTRRAGGARRPARVARRAARPGQPACSSGTRTTPSIVMWSCGNESFGGTNMLAVADCFRALRHPAGALRGRPLGPALPGDHRRGQPDVHPGGRDRGSSCRRTATSRSSCASTPTRWATRSAPWTSTSIWPTASRCSRAASSGTSPTRRSALTRPARQASTSATAATAARRPTTTTSAPTASSSPTTRPTPKLQEVKYLYQGVPHRDHPATPFEVENRLLFTRLVGLRLRGDACPARASCWPSTGVETDVAPGGVGDLPAAVRAARGRPASTPSTCRSGCAQATAWAPAGHEVAWEQAVFTVTGPTPVAARRRPHGRR